MDTSAHKRILLVDDECVIAMAGAEVLAQHGFDVILASSGKGAVDLVRDDPSIDLVLMDIDLGKGMDGQGAAREILKIRNLPIVFLTSHSEREMVEKVKGITRYGYVLKNAGDFVLVSSIEMAFELFYAHERTRQEEERYRTLFTNMSEAFALGEPIPGDDGSFHDFRFLEVNDAFELHTGLKRAEVVGRPITEVLPHVEPCWIDTYCRVATTGESITFRNYNRDTDRYYQVFCYCPVRGRFAILFSDLTEERLAEQRLRDREQWLRMALHGASAGVWTRDLAEGTITWSPENYELYGVEPSEGTVSYDAWEQLVHPDDLAALRQLLRDAIEGRSREFRAEFRIRHRRRGVRWLLGLGRVERDQHGTPVRMAGINLDITERKRAEETRSRLAAIVEFSDEAIIGHDVDGTIVSWNRGAEKIYGYSAVEMIGRPIQTIYPPGREGEFARLMGSITRGEPVDYHDTVRVRKDGGLIHISLSLSPVRDQNGSLVGISAIARDITDRKQNEERLRQSEERFREVVENIREVFWIADLNMSEMFYVSPAYERIWGRSCESLYADPGSWMEAVVAEDRPLALAIMEGKDARLGHDLEYRIVGHDGTVRWIWDRGHPVRNQSGEIYRIARIAEDITDRKRTEHGLRESEERYRVAIEHSNDGVAIVRGDEHVFVNHRFLDMFGYDQPEEIVNRPGFTTVHEDDRERVANLNRQRQAGESVPSRYAFKGMRRDGSVIYVEVSATRIVYQGTPATLAYLRDVTERTHAEDLIRSSLKEKEALLKEIHHRVKNNLQIISSMLYLQAKGTKHPGAVEALRASQNRVRSMALIHEKLYKSPQLSSVDMAEYTRGLARQIFDSYRDTGAPIGLKVTTEEVSLSVSRAIPCGLIINELISNALKHAFPEGKEGQIAVELHKVNGSQLELVVRDNGIGMPGDVSLQDAPTLGLNLVASLVEQLDGTIELMTEGGTSFIIGFAPDAPH